MERSWLSSYESSTPASTKHREAYTAGLIVIASEYKALDLPFSSIRLIEAFHYILPVLSGPQKFDHLLSLARAIPLSILAWSGYFGVFQDISSESP